MPKLVLTERLREQLFRRGWPGAPVSRVVREVAEHWEDLEAEGRQEGLDPAAAARRADERLGDVDALVSQLAETFRRGSWAGRHPLFCFVVLPLLGLIGWFVGWAMLAMGVAEALVQLKLTAVPIYHSYAAVVGGAAAIRYSGMVIVPLLAWRWAMRSFCGWKWGWAACAICAVHGYFNHIFLRPHSVQWAYSIGPAPDWLALLTPLATGVLARWWVRRDQARAGAALARVLALSGCVLGAGGLLAGCASKPAEAARERGWIGGDYAAAKAGRFHGPGGVPAFPPELKRVQSAGVLVTGLRSNTPAYLAGLREGDLILKVGSRPMTSLSAFHRCVAEARPGSPVTFTLFRDGETLEQPVRVGRETYRRWHSLSTGLLLSSTVDLWPDPNFSLIALGYGRKARWIDLDSPEARFIQRNQAPPGPVRELDGGESWQLWLGVIGLGANERILSQTRPTTEAGR